MKKIIRYPILKILHIIRFFLKYLIKFVFKTLVIIRINAIPEIKLNKSKPKKTINIYNTTENIKKNYDQFIEDEYKDSYNYFKKYFYTSLMVNDRYAALRYAINKSLSNHEEDNLYLEKGKLASNAQLVEKAIRIVSDLGVSIMTPSETREKLKLVKHK